MKKIIIAGATGTLGRKSLKLIEKYADFFVIDTLIANKNAINDETILLSKSKNPDKKLDKIIRNSSADIVVNVISGVAGIPATRAALESGKILLLGNKESLVAAGQEFLPYLEQIIPLDSEHNAAFEIIRRNPRKTPKTIYLSCSGGPLLGRTPKQLATITPEEALQHPKWKMGQKITLESATLLNKGLEIIEAHYLFGLPIGQIHTFLNPQCRIHAIVEFDDGARLAYISEPDMSEHIENALLYCLGKSPARQIRPLEEDEIELTEPDHYNLPGIKIVLEKFRRQPDKMLEFLRLEEETLDAFLNGQISFPEIFSKLQHE